MTDPFLADALEGFDNTPGDHLKALQELDQALASRVAHGQGGTQAQEQQASGQQTPDQPIPGQQAPGPEGVQPTLSPHGWKGMLTWENAKAAMRWGMVAALLLTVFQIGRLSLYSDGDQPKLSLSEKRTDPFEVYDQSPVLNIISPEQEADTLPPREEKMLRREEQRSREQAAVHTGDILLIVPNQTEAELAAELEKAAEDFHPDELHGIKAVTAVASAPRPDSANAKQSAEKAADMRGLYSFDASGDASPGRGYIGGTQKMSAAKKELPNLTWMDTAQPSDGTAALSESLSGSVAGITVEGQAARAAKPAAGEGAFSDYLKANTPKLYDRDGKRIRGRVVMTFRVDVTGRPYGITVRDSLAPQADSVAVSLLGKGPDWTPGEGQARIRF